MLKAVQSGQIEIIPERFKKTYFHWIKNLRDWCISRQIWYGHRIPVWHCGDKLNATCKKENGINVSVDSLVACRFCTSRTLEQDPDTLDTWFSSGLWTFSTLGWPDQSDKEKATNDLEMFHPMTVLETGYDILFFWVARMILMTGFLIGDVPFKTVYLNGLVRGEDRQKMSKSKGNAIDPLGVADIYGTDAVRMALIVGNAPGNDPIISEDKIRGYRNFATKIWNIARFILMQSDKVKATSDKGRIQFTAVDKKRLKEFAAFKKTVTKDMDEFRFHEASAKIYHYLWHTFADKILEETKARLASDNKEDAQAAHAMLTEIFIDCLKLLHPFMPFVTEELYQTLGPKKKHLLMVTPW